MNEFPEIASPCPYRGPLADIVNGSTCRVCNRTVHDLDSMDEATRRALLEGDGDGLCVKYTLQAPPVSAANQRSCSPESSPRSHGPLAGGTRATLPAEDVQRPRPAELEPWRELKGYVERKEFEVPDPRHVELLRLERERRLKALGLEVPIAVPMKPVQHGILACPRCNGATRGSSRYCTRCGLNLCEPHATP